MFINTISNINELINLLESVLRVKSVRAKLVKNVTNTVSNIVNTFALLKQNTETECNKEKYWAQEM